jgi:hypothetical protein
MTRGPETITSVTITIDIKGASFTDGSRCIDWEPDIDNPDYCANCYRPYDENHGAKTEESVTWGVKWVLDEALAKIREQGISALDNRNLWDINGQTVGRIIIEREEKGS